MKKCFLFAMALALSVPSFALKVGDQAPVIEVPLLEGTKAGQNESVSSYKGNLIYLDFWASWCGPCRQSLPILNEVRKEYGPQGFEVVAVNVDEKLKDALGFLKKYPVDYPVLLDAKGEMPKAYDVQGMPTAFLLDEKGTVLYKHEGFKKSDRAKIEALIEKHLAGN